jgi:hypothetical protein
MFGTESFDDFSCGQPPLLPIGWNGTVVQGNGGFVAGVLPGPPDPRFGCRSLVANAAQGGGGPLLCIVETGPDLIPPRLELMSLCKIEWSQRYQPSPGASAQVSVVVSGVPTIVYSTNVASPPSSR